MSSIKFALIGLIFFVYAFASYAPDDPIRWVASKDLVLDSKGEPNDSFIRDLIVSLEADTGPGSKVSRQEFLDLLNRPGGSLVYRDAIMKYAFPQNYNSKATTKKTTSKVTLRKKKILEGAAFMRQYYNLLDKAESRYGILKKDIVSILMVETDFGKYTGDYSTFNIFLGQILFLDAANKYCIDEVIRKNSRDPYADTTYKNLELSRIARRKMYAVRGLSSLLRYSKQFNMDPLQQKGSWGGAIGYVQFMPFNLKYAVDADNDGKANLYTWPDAIYSVCNYLVQEGSYDKSLKGRKRAVYSYNHSNYYVETVVKYADAIERAYR